jgi:hypothetical protein
MLAQELASGGQVQPTMYRICVRDRLPQFAEGSMPRFTEMPPPHDWT